MIRHASSEDTRSVFKLRTNWKRDDFDDRGNFCECWRREPLGGSGSMVDPQKALKSLLEHSWQFFVLFLYGASVHLNLRARPCVYQIAWLYSTNQNAQNGLGEFCTLSVYIFTKSVNVLKEMVHALAVHLWSYGCTWEAGRALEKLEKHSASPRATQTLLSCSPNLPPRRTSSMDHFFIPAVSGR